MSGGVKTIYVDGNTNAQTGTTGWNTAGPASANQFWIGASPDPGDGVASLNGLVDEVYLFNRALSQIEIQNLKSNQTVVPIGIITGALPATSPVFLAASAALDLSGTSQTIASLADISGSGGVVTNSGASATLTFNATTTNTFTGAIHGNLALVKSSSGTQSLNGANSYNGNTTVNGGTLAFAQATLPTNGIVTVTNGAVLSLNFTVTNRVVGIVLNGASQSSGIYNAASSAPYIAGTGSLQIGIPVALNPTNISFALTGGTLTLFWPATHTGWQLQTQTNPTTAGLGTNWFTLLGSTDTNAWQMSVIPTSNNNVFFRLAYP